MLRRKELFLELVEPLAVGSVVVARALLVLDDVALIVEVLLVEGVQKRRHPVGLEPQRQLQLVARHRLEVVGSVQPGRAVERPAGRLDQAHVLSLGNVARALEHDVLEEVGKAGLAGNLVLGADRIPDADRDDRGQMVFGDDQPQPVGQSLVGEPDCRCGHAVGLLEDARSRDSVTATPRPMHCTGRRHGEGWRQAPRPPCEPPPGRAIETGPDAPSRLARTLHRP